MDWYHEKFVFFLIFFNLLLFSIFGGSTFGDKTGLDVIFGTVSSVGIGGIDSISAGDL